MLYNNIFILPLDSLELYIKTNKHLPGIPSELEMKKNSVDVIDLNIKLLQKVEELTLYVIELNKKIKEQDIKIKRLERYDK